MCSRKGLPLPASAPLPATNMHQICCCPHVPWLFLAKLEWRQFSFHFHTSFLPSLAPSIPHSFHCLLHPPWWCRFSRAFNLLFHVVQGSLKSGQPFGQPSASLSRPFLSQDNLNSGPEGDSTCYKDIHINNNNHKSKYSMSIYCVLDMVLDVLYGSISFSSPGTLTF